MRSRKLLWPLYIALVFVAVGWGSAKALTLLTVTQTGAAAVVDSDETTVLTTAIVSATTLRVRVQPTASAQATTSYTVRVDLDDATSASATVSWTAAQVTAATAKNVDVTGLTRLPTQNRYVTVTR